ncbi:hypothetical protein SAMN02745134_00514 [Clostridium acidisoli DSM 12555]|uniref:Uncharacterized protein n=1 Tax=Clostridium acidisoli DSM 12555 TaxID=1121291 RepID=A0A1W1X2N4_9CLOT|nr:hypothetical protein [Clostridium acidisoli]SMC18174.1 hypothetical protein SAMN02745134_00514 [Clostridium acidisoli DSM 12555]
MSSFLGKIHYLLYNKIQVNEEILEEVLRLAEEKNIDVNSIKDRVYEKYGYPEKRALEDVIEHDNIHGWLQSKIQSVENRTAAIITELTSGASVDIDEIAEVYFKNGEKIMKGSGEMDCSPKKLFDLIFDYMLEGMPCDMINQVISESENEFEWKTTRCIHKEYWENVNGNVLNFYSLRTAWINGFLSAAGANYSYVRNGDGYNKITKEAN